jgi:fido (protein-threonine AMPylation protein)
MPTSNEPTTSVRYSWHPIERLAETDRRINLADIRPLYDTWRAAKKRLKDANGEALKSFTDRVVRSLSIETGIIERIYDLDRGTTEALVTQGFRENLVLRGSTNIEPAALIEILHDQEAAIRLVMDCIGSNRELTKGFVHELHSTITRHQSTTEAIDQFGQRIQIPLLRGHFKEFPNNPVRDDGAVHEYCPPIHVDSEMENLLQWFSEYARSEDPMLLSAWLHHRFTQIHPYQDGNGRMARALSTLVLLKSDLLPVVIDRDSRTDYLRALESGDGGDLAPLVTQFANIEKRAILQALSVETETEPDAKRSVSKAVIASLKTKLEKRFLARDGQLRKVNIVARSLRDRAENNVQSALKLLEHTLVPIGESHVDVTPGGPDRGNQHWYKFEVVQSERSSSGPHVSEGGIPRPPSVWVNFEEDHYFVKGTIRLRDLRLGFVTSLHHVGRELSGVMEATAFAWLESYENAGDRALPKQFFVSSLEPFVIAWNTDVTQVTALFDEWLDSAMAIAFKEFGDRV